MKRNILVVFFVILAVNFFSCGTSNRNLKNSSDWAGVYTGVIPGADTDGIDVEVTLSDDETYEVIYHYLTEESDETFIHSGTFKWTKDGSVVILDTVEIPPFYRIGENTLTQLDMAGKVITGDFADNYVLKKKQ
jgi:uncharacterized lipoprotein NlpE involved in copper resistance